MSPTTVVLADLDGTLAEVHSNLSAAGARILEAMVAKGTLIVLVTGSAMRDVERRVIGRIHPDCRRSFVVYANNGGCCFAAVAGGIPALLYDHGEEFSRYRDAIVGLVGAYTAREGLGEIREAPGWAATSGAVCVEHKESQVTLTLLGIEHVREKMVADLHALNADTFGHAIRICAAGRKSIDISLSKDRKSSAVTHFLSRWPRLGSAGRRDFVIVGDSFGDDGADSEMLHPSLAGATVFSAGSIAPMAKDFTVIHAKYPGPESTFRFLSWYFQI
jgi:hydroxymethylpyrimidine pyrophosphatase-like HAD family hydrolase